MDDNEFYREAALLLTRCSPEQRKSLADMAEKFGKPKDEAGAGAQDRKVMAKDSRGFDNPASGKSFDEMFPNRHRLKL